MEGVYEELSKVNVNEHVEKKNGLSYLTWSWAWDEVKKRFPEAHYDIKKNEQGLPYVYDERTGYMVYTSVIIHGIEHEMWLPVMDGANKAMKAHEYTYKTKYGEKSVAPATMFDINKTIMRCLVKNLAMFGLGLYIYAGEDLPEEEKKEQEDVLPKVIAYIKKMDKESQEKICKAYKIKDIDSMKVAQALHYKSALEKNGGTI